MLWSIIAPERAVVNQPIDSITVRIELEALTDFQYRYELNDFHPLCMIFAVPYNGQDMDGRTAYLTEPISVLPWDEGDVEDANGETLGYVYEFEFKDIYLDIYRDVYIRNNKGLGQGPSFTEAAQGKDFHLLFKLMDGDTCLSTATAEHPISVVTSEEAEALNAYDPFNQPPDYFNLEDIAGAEAERRLPNSGQVYLHRQRQFQRHLAAVAAQRHERASQAHMQRQAQAQRQAQLRSHAQYQRQAQMQHQGQPQPQLRRSSQPSLQRHALSQAPIHSQLPNRSQARAQPQAQPVPSAGPAPPPYAYDPPGRQIRTVPSAQRQARAQPPPSSPIMRANRRRAEIERRNALELQKSRARLPPADPRRTRSN